MVDAGVAIKLDVPIYSYREGNPCEEREAYGLAQDIKITHPESIIFGDEVGVQCNQKKDNQVAGEKFMSEGHCTAIVFFNTRFQVHPLPFTSASRAAIAYVVIFKSERTHKRKGILSGGVSELETRYRPLGYQNPVKDENGNIIFEANLGPEKYYPGGPTCNYLRKSVPCFAYASDRGVITA